MIAKKFLEKADEEELPDVKIRLNTDWHYQQVSSASAVENVLSLPELGALFGPGCNRLPFFRWYPNVVGAFMSLASFQ